MKSYFFGLRRGGKVHCIKSDNEDSPFPWSILTSEGWTPIQLVGKKEPQKIAFAEELEKVTLTIQDSHKTIYRLEFLVIFSNVEKWIANRDYVRSLNPCINYGNLNSNDEKASHEKIVQIDIQKKMNELVKLNGPKAVHQAMIFDDPFSNKHIEIKNYLTD